MQRDKYHLLIGNLLPSGTKPNSAAASNAKVMCAPRNTGLNVQRWMSLVVAAAATTAVANFLRADPVSTLQIFSNQCCSVMLSLATI